MNKRLMKRLLLLLPLVVPIGIAQAADTGESAAGIMGRTWDFLHNGTVMPDASTLPWSDAFGWHYPGWQTAPLAPFPFSPVSPVPWSSAPVAGPNLFDYPAPFWGAEPAPVQPHPLEGSWLGTSGEKLEIRQGLFRMAWGPFEMEGELDVAGNWVMMSVPLMGMRQAFLYRRSGDWLLFGDGNGGRMIFRRAYMKSGW